MVRLNKLAVLLVALLCVGVTTAMSAPGPSTPFNPGSLIFSLQLAEQTVTTVDTIGVDPDQSVGIYRPNQQGFKFGVGYCFNPRWAANLSATWGFSKDNSEPVGGPQQKISTSSLSFRLGMDAYFPISHTFSMYVGPGFMLNRARSTVTSGTSEITNPWTTNWTLSGHMGFVAKVSPVVGFYGDVGQQVVMGSVTTLGGNKTSWTTSHPEANIGVAFFIDTHSGRSHR